MRKLSVKNLVDFRKKSDRAKMNFVQNIKLNKPAIITEGGGDYWTISLSAVCHAFKEDDLQIIDEKIAEVQQKLKSAKATVTQMMYQRNIKILENYLDIDLKKLRPGGRLLFQKKSTGNTLLMIKGLEVEVDAKRCQAYAFGKKDEESVGAIWFVTQVKGYRIEEVGMFCEMLYRFLKHNYGKKYSINPKYCIAVDLLGGHIVSYSQIEDGTIPKVLTPTLDAINKLI
jgi:hypothetical protein